MQFKFFSIFKSLEQKDFDSFFKVISLFLG